jgi:hypothetical protein
MMNVWTRTFSHAHWLLRDISDQCGDIRLDDGSCGDIPVWRYTVGWRTVWRYTSVEIYGWMTDRVEIYQCGDTRLDDGPCLSSDLALFLSAIFCKAKRFTSRQISWFSLLPILMFPIRTFALFMMILPSHSMPYNVMQRKPVTWFSLYISVVRWTSLDVDTCNPEIFFCFLTASRQLHLMVVSFHIPSSSSSQSYYRLTLHNS